MRKIKRVLTGILAATMVMASVMTAGAATGSGGPGSGGSGSGSTGTSANTNSSSESSSPVAEAAKYVASANAAISVAGMDVHTTIGGCYAAKSVAGCAIVTSLADVKAALGLSAGQDPYIIIYDTDYNKSSKAMASINAAAEALGAKVLTALNIELGAKQDGKFVTLTNGSIGMVAGIPNADPSKTYSVICVQPGGAITILDDLDMDPSTITFEVSAGLGTYAVVEQ